MRQSHICKAFMLLIIIVRVDVIARRYHLPKEKIYVNMDRFGNTSSASVPICLNEMRKNGLLKEGQTIVCTGFGGGLTYGAFVIKL